MRTFRHLTKAEIKEIIVAYHTEKPQPTKADLGRRFNVDHSTINYHLARYERTYPEDGGVYALINVDIRKTCVHPSSRCTFCHQMRDEIERSERAQIAKLTAELERARSWMRIHGIPVE
jgi:hypothetical protein